MLLRFTLVAFHAIVACVSFFGTNFVRLGISVIGPQPLLGRLFSHGIWLDKRLGSQDNNTHAALRQDGYVLEVPVEHITCMRR